MAISIRIARGLAVAALLGGCRTATRTVEMPRVDLDVSGGNRGYLVGTPSPSSGPAKTTREMVETEIELPSTSRAKPGAGGPVGLGEIAPPEVDLAEETAAGVEPSQTDDTYIVKEGDTLWSIAANPQVYGDATKWRRLAEANRDVLKSPDRLRAGLSLRIPRHGGTAAPSTDTRASEFSK